MRGPAPAAGSAGGHGGRRRTSGIVVAGKSVVGLQEMSAAFHDRTIKNIIYVL